MNEQKSSTAKRVFVIVLVIGLIIASVYPVIGPFIMGGEKDKEEKVIYVEIIMSEDEVIEKTYQTKYVKLGDFLEQTKLVKFDTDDYGRYVKTCNNVKAEDGQAWIVTVNGKDIEDGIDFTKLTSYDKVTIELVTLG